MTKVPIPDANGEYSDELLLEHVRVRAEELGRMPSKEDVELYRLLKGRFGPWPRVLEAAGLKQPTARKTTRQKREAAKKRRKEYLKAERLGQTEEKRENEE